MITYYKKANLSSNQIGIETNILFDTLTKQYFFNPKLIEYKDKKFKFISIHITKDNKMLGTNNPRFNKNNLHDDFIREFCNRNLSESFNVLVKYKREEGKEEEVWLDEDGKLSVIKQINFISITELVDIANAYPNNADLGNYIRTELLKDE